ncbi:glycosyltransferase family 2 protein [Candidatus Gottesmanbacteria bacterium]|nr:glycosyltransferase family 2 protein [Candidatus Gottesmanbacteria bacterium]
MNISAIIITRNEEENIAECIESLDFTDEIVAVDNHSNDQTIAKAKLLKAKVYQVAGLDFSYLRNIGKEKAKSEWLLYVDADERISNDLAEEIKVITAKPSTFSAFYVLRQNYYFGKLWPNREKIIRLIKKEALIGWQGKLHETPIVAGKVGYLKAPLLHYTHRDLTSMVKKTNEWSEIEAQLRYKSGHPSMSWWRFFRVMISAFLESYFNNGGWKVGTTGLIESIYQAFSMFITYAKLWEKQNKRLVMDDR